MGIDLSKNVFQLHGVDEKGQVVLAKRKSRAEIRSAIANLPKCVIGMEACGGAHYWAREFRSHGHEVKVMAAQFVKPYVKSNKNDRADAEAICEAVSRPNMRFVGIKTIEQQDIQSLHRIRRRCIGNRTALVNETRGLLLEYGIAVPKGIGQLRRALPVILEDGKNELTAAFGSLLGELQEELGEMDQKLLRYDTPIRKVSGFSGWWKDGENSKPRWLWPIRMPG
jgi:transposase